jgi:hypothetical protein
LYASAGEAPGDADEAFTAAWAADAVRRGAAEPEPDAEEDAEAKEAAEAEAETQAKANAGKKASKGADADVDDADDQILRELRERMGGAALDDEEDDDDDGFFGNEGGDMDKIWYNGSDDDGDDEDDGAGGEEQEDSGGVSSAAEADSKAPAEAEGGAIGFGSIAAVAPAEDFERLRRQCEEAKKADSAEGSAEGRKAVRFLDQGDEDASVPAAAGTGAAGLDDGALLDQSGAPMPVTIPLRQMTVFGMGAFGLLSSCLLAWRSPATGAVLAGLADTEEAVVRLRRSVGSFENSVLDAAAEAAAQDAAAIRAQASSAPAAAGSKADESARPLPPYARGVEAVCRARREYIAHHLLKSAPHATRRPVPVAEAGSGGIWATLEGAVTQSAADLQTDNQWRERVQLLVASFTVDAPVLALKEEHWQLLAAILTCCFADRSYADATPCPAASAPAPIAALEALAAYAVAQGKLDRDKDRAKAAKAVKAAGNTDSAAASAMDGDAKESAFLSLLLPEQFGSLEHMLLSGPDAPRPPTVARKPQGPAGTSRSAPVLAKKPAAADPWREEEKRLAAAEMEMLGRARAQM